MPKKRNTSWSRSKKEKQIITARLIEISLKVDDYIYKHKLISVWEAEQFIREVSSYKVQCCRDERSLQVIEKLTRCMRAIILDHQGPTTKNYTINNDNSITGGVFRAASISPVYSIPDEDRTQLSQLAEEANNNVDIIDLSNIDDDDDSMHSVTNPIASENAGSRVTVEVDIHKGISSLSLIDVDEPNDMAISTEVNCSQSILNNFEGVENMQHNEIKGLADNISSNEKTANVMEETGNNSIDKTPKIKIAPMIEPNKSVKTTTISNKLIINYNTKNESKFNTFVKNNEPFKVSNDTNNGLTNAFNQKNNTIQTMCPTINHVPEIQRQTWYDSNRTCTVTDSSHMLADPKHFSQTRQIYKDIIDMNQVRVTKAGTVNVNIPTNTFNTTEKSKQTIVNFPDNQRQTWHDSNRTCTVTDSSHMRTDPKHFIQNIYKDVIDMNKVRVTKAGTVNVKIPKNNFNTAEKNKETTASGNSRAPLQNKGLITNTAVVQENTATTKKKRGAKKKNLTDEKEIKPKNKRVYRKNPRNKENTLTNTNKNKTIPIYNENVVDDLSWMENIRYVREIRIDENDPKFNLEESFWDNYYLPANWSEKEFL